MLKSLQLSSLLAPIKQARKELPRAVADGNNLGVIARNAGGSRPNGTKMKAQWDRVCARLSGTRAAGNTSVPPAD